MPLFDPNGALGNLGNLNLISQTTNYFQNLFHGVGWQG
jgi:hypothetical protein